MSTAFTLWQIRPDQLSATDLLREAIASKEPAEAYYVTVEQNAEPAQALYFPTIKRLSIAWGADATSASVDDLVSGVALWLDDGPAWTQAN